MRWLIMGYNFVKLVQRYLPFVAEERLLELYPTWWLMRIKAKSLANH